MYIPDYKPHFSEEMGDFGSQFKDVSIGQNLVGNAQAILTSSLFAKSYLPLSRLQVPENKIKMVSLPVHAEEMSSFRKAILDVFDNVSSS